VRLEGAYPDTELVLIFRLAGEPSGLTAGGARSGETRPRRRPSRTLTKT
jgi:hypothetical protein